jgi:hypothetical protein
VELFDLITLIKVRPTNDGTFQQDVLLTEDQAEYLLHKLRIPIHGSRTKRQAIYMEQMPAQIWEFGKPIPYTFDSSMSKFFAALYLISII